METILTKRLQLLFHIFCIFYVTGDENPRENNERNLYETTSNDLGSIFLLDYSENEIFAEDTAMKNELERIPYVSATKNIKIEPQGSIIEKYTLELNNETLDYHHSTSQSTNTIYDLSSSLKEERIKEVMNLTVEDKDLEWILISWKTPFPELNNTINYTIITHYNGTNITTDLINYTQSEVTHNVTELKPCTEYTFTVIVSTQNWSSEGISLTQATSSKLTSIEDVQELNIVDITKDMLKLAWKIPIKYSNCISGYRVTQCVTKHCNHSINETLVSTMEYEATNLELCTEYFFTVKIVTQYVISPGVNISEKTNSQKPSKPRLLSVIPESFALNISWQSPEIAAQCIQKYRVTIDKMEPIYTEKTVLIVSDLSACTSYLIRVTAINDKNEEGNVAETEGITTPAVSISPESDTEKRNTSVNSISITWNIRRSKNNACKLMLLKTVCNYTEVHGHGYKPKNGEIELLFPTDIVTSIIAVVQDLSPFTTYICSGIIINVAGTSLPGIETATTSQDVPSAPVISATNITSTHFTLFWEEPQYQAGVLSEYEISIIWKLLSLKPDWCFGDTFGTDTITVNGSLLYYEYSEGRPFTEYTVNIKAKTIDWGNYSEIIEFETHPAVPGQISNFSYSIQENSQNINILDTILTWGLPCQLNGVLESFCVSVHGTRMNYKSHSFSEEKKDVSDITNNDMYSTSLEELKGEYNYTFTISAKVKGISTCGTATSFSGILYPAGIPPQPSKEYIRAISIDPYAARRSTTSVSVLLPLFPDVNGNVKYYAIMVSEKGYNPAMETRFNLTKHVWPNVTSWEEAMEKDFIIPYQATRLKWNPYPNYVADYGHIKVVKYAIGEDTTCKEISSNTHERLYCNGPLKPNTWYHVRMRAFTEGGYSDSVTFLVKTNSELDVPAVIGIVFGILFLGITTTMMLLVRKCSPRAILRRFLNSDMPGSPVPAPFTRKKFLAHCQQLIDNPGKLSNEFRLLQTLSVDLQMPTNTAGLQANRKKNRYSDILPYDFSRVKLEIIDNDPNTDYINASFIKGYSGEDEYIACQGPKEETTYDFWRMIDQYEINLIVMLTELIEKGKEKCHQYYPTIRETFRYENMTIKCTSELDFRTYTQRTLMLQKENKKRNITHLHFKDWPDHDVPEDFDPMINFCQIMRRNIIANKGFAVIHCSAGIGRTGTLIAIDILLQHIRDNRKLDVFGTVYRLRHHRLNMVQRESQYAYIYNCIKQVLKNPYFLKTYKPPSIEPLYKKESNKTKQSENAECELVTSHETCM